MRKLYIDFDNTLYNTLELKEKRKVFLKKYIHELEIQKIINTFNGLFDFRNVLDVMIDKYKIDKDTLYKDYDDLLKYNYLYDDTIEFLNYYKDKYELILLTYGNNDYQLDKINCTNIKEYFKEIIITQKNKNILDIDYNNSTFIDDNPKELKGLLNNNSYKVIRLCRGKYKDIEKELDVLSVNSLKEIIEKGLI